jgi:hypothetical protein
VDGRARDKPGHGLVQRVVPVILDSNSSILVVVAEQGQVNRIGHSSVAGIVAMRVIAAVLRRQNARGVAPMPAA